MNEFDQMVGGMDFDPVTGQEPIEVTEAQQEVVQNKAIEDGEKLLSLSKHPGWKLIREMMEATIEKERYALLHARHMDFITMTQALIKARMDLLGWIEMKMVESKSLLEESK